MARRGCFMALGFDDSAQPTSLRVALCSPLGTALTTRGVTPMHQETSLYNRAQSSSDREICDLLAQVIDIALPEAENKVWHAHPVWFLDGNPVVGYSKLKGCVRLLFWSRFRHLALNRKASSRRLKRASCRLIRLIRKPCVLGLLRAEKCSGTTRTLSAEKANWSA